jgi:protein phosphatase PTC6
VLLSSPKVIGVANSRGNRVHQEDFYAFATLSLNPEELRLSLKKWHGVDWEPNLISEPHSNQVLFVGLYDGHGGSAVAQYLRQELHGLIESVDKALIPELFKWTQELGGYFKRFKGGALSPWLKEPNPEEMDLEARATLAFFEVDRSLSSVDNTAQTCGATASVVILQCLDSPTAPFFFAQKIALYVAHCGDTRVILASQNNQAFPMTEKHHPDTPVESIRLRKMMGTSLITDSFGESRWMGRLQNTRSLGDLQYKRFGITPEPDVRTKLLQGNEWAFIVLVSDGISSILSDQEIVDLARGAPDPKSAANRVLSFSQDLGGDDNATAIVIPLAGWRTPCEVDRTKELREYRLRQAVGSERQKRM